jgi:hypothetical protein
VGVQLVNKAGIGPSVLQSDQQKAGKRVTAFRGQKSFPAFMQLAGFA